VASELHDDFSQRLALLAFGLQNTAETPPDSPDTLKQTLDEFRQSVCELGDDLHSLSHHLHSSTLDTLGLVTGLRSLCREFGARQGIEIDFASEDVPRTVRPEVSLCLFRIVQEGLQNMKKHSGAKKARVSLRNFGGKLFLSLCDEGMGFDANRLEKSGLGILSMQGRARLLGGDFEVHSKPGKGTRIEAWVPLEPVADPLNVWVCVTPRNILPPRKQLNYKLRRLWIPIGFLARPGPWWCEQGGREVPYRVPHWSNPESVSVRLRLPLVSPHVRFQVSQIRGQQQPQPQGLTQLGAAIYSTAISCMVDGKQHVILPVGAVLFAFALDHP
jgi:two-component sensor histidine kinase